MRFFLFLTALLLLVSCEGPLDAVQPRDERPLDEAFDSVEDLEAALVGAYDALQSPDLAGRSLLYFSDLLGGNVRPSVDEFVQIADLTIATDNSFVADFWNRAYAAIQQLNLLLASLEAVAENDANATPVLLDRLEGEARFLRGMLYFELVRYFALPYGATASTDPGVPLVLSPVTRVEALTFPSRASVAAAYGQVGSDLGAAQALLPEANPQGRGRADRLTATAYLAKVAFQREQYALAAEYADDLLFSSPAALTPEPVDFFVDEGSPEEVWTVISGPDDGTSFSGLTAFYHPIFESSRITDSLKVAGYEAMVTPAQWAALSNALPNARVADLRCYTGAIAEPPLITADTLFTLKYEDAANFADDAPLARLAEFLLMRAEIHARDGEKKAAVQLLNQVRRRALRVVDERGFLLPDGEELLLFSTDDFIIFTDLMEAIHRERRVELAFEGNYFHDLVRRRADVQGFPYDADRLRLPIPQREMDLNPNLVQNPGYE